MLVMYAPEQEESEILQSCSVSQLQIQEVCMHVDTRYYKRNAPLYFEYVPSSYVKILERELGKNL